MDAYSVVKATIVFSLLLKLSAGGHHHVVGESAGHAHSQEQNNDHVTKTEFMEAIFKKYNHNGSLVMGFTAFKELLSDVGIGKDKYHRSKERGKPNDVTKNCFSAERLLQVFDLNVSQGLTQDELSSLSPALLQQVAHQACSIIEPVEPRPSLVEIYVEGTIAVAILSAAAVSGLFVVGFRNKPAYTYLLACMMGLGFASLVGDACIILIPEALGFHGDEFENETDYTESTIPSYVQKMIAMFCSMYGFFLLDILTSSIWEGGNCPGHGMAPSQTSKTISAIPQSNDSSPDGNERKKKSSTSSIEGQHSMMLRRTTTAFNIAYVHDQLDEGGTVLGSPVIPGNVGEDEGEVEGANTQGCTQLAWMLTVGDAIHNFADGLAIGAAFATSTSSGISTTIAIFCHEVPHEIGDVAVLLSTGMSAKRALMLNLLCSVMCFIGLYIGIAVSQNAVARQWMFAVSAGMFFYVGLVEMVPEIVKRIVAHRESHVGMLISINIGIIVGAGVIVVVAVFGKTIQV